MNGWTDRWQINRWAGESNSKSRVDAGGLMYGPAILIPFQNKTRCQLVRETAWGPRRSADSDDIVFHSLLMFCFFNWSIQLIYNVFVSGVQRNDSDTCRILSVFPIIIVQLLSHVWLCSLSWTTACQAPLSCTTSRSLLKLTSIKPVNPGLQHCKILYFLNRQGSPFPISGYHKTSNLVPCTVQQVFVVYINLWNLMFTIQAFLKNRKSSISDDYNLKTFWYLTKEAKD